MYMPGRDTMHLRNKQAARLFLFLLLASGLFLRLQGQSNPVQPQQHQQQTPPTALPADVDPADPALPVWARPAPVAASANATNPTDVPPGKITPPQGRVGEVTKSGGTYVYRSQVD